MINEKTLEILKEMKADPKAKELFEGMEKPKSLDEMVSAYAQIAEKLGYNITAEDIREVAKQEDTKRKAKTDKVVSDMEALEDDDLEGVAGGYYYYFNRGIRKYDQCVSDFTETNCRITDACENFVNNYYDCRGDYFEAGAEFDCYLNQFWF